MAILQQIFKGKLGEAPSKRLCQEDISVETLKQLIPIRNLSDEKLQAFVLENKAEVYKKNTTLFVEGESSQSVIYLLRGTVILMDKNDCSYEVDAETAKGKFPLASGKIYTMTAKTKSDVSILQVSSKIMSIGTDVTNKQKKLTLPADLEQNQLMQAFSQHYLDDELEIPSMPAVAMELRKAMQSDIGIAEAVKFIQLDPVMSAKLVQVANCPLYISANPAKSCFEAVNRIGLNATKNLIISLSLKQVFSSNNKLISSYLEKAWKHSIYISGICHVLAKITKSVDPEEALLAGLISDIGIVPFLSFASNVPADYFTEAELGKIIPYIRGPIGSNVLLKWDFPSDLIEIPSIAENWYYHQGDDINLADIVILSRLHSKIGKPSSQELPAITSIPAASKLENTCLSPENSLQVLHDAKHKINDALQVFSG